MFTGIVSGVGIVVLAEANRLGIEHAPTARRLKVGSSVAINGCCLTVVTKSGATFVADVVPETLRRTNLGALTLGARVNLELPLAASGFTVALIPHTLGVTIAAGYRGESMVNLEADVVARYVARNLHR